MIKKIGNRWPLFKVIVFLIFFTSCKKDFQIKEYKPTLIEYDIPDLFQNKITNEPTNNPLTKEGVELGRMLFYDPILSKDNSISCSSCHQQENGFSDRRKFSFGVNKTIGIRNSMPIVNALWGDPFFWDGRSLSLEHQAFSPVRDSNEMNLGWFEVIARLQYHDTYPDLFYAAFGSYKIDSNMVVKAISQFERTLISANSKWDQFRRSGKEPFDFFTLQEFQGYTIFFTESGDCFHCHGQKELLTDNLFHNNGLDENFQD